MPTPPRNLARQWFAGLGGVGLIALVSLGPTHVLAAQEGSANVRQGAQELSDVPKPSSQQPGSAVTEVRRIPKPSPARKSAPIKERPKASSAITESEVDNRDNSLPKK